MFNLLYTGTITDDLERLSEKEYHITMPDGTVWKVPVMVIALNRAEHYASLEDIPLSEQLENDTAPLFLECEFEINDWARCNMDWNDVKRYATLVGDQMTPADYESGWVNGMSRVK